MKIALVDISFHKKTKSFDFFRDFVKKKHEIVNFWDESWEGGTTINIDDVNNGNFDLIIFLQILLRPTVIKKLNCKNIIWVPMYDVEVTRNIPVFGYLYFNIKIVSFSQTLTCKLRKIGFDVINVQYYPRPDIINHSKDDLAVFFWQRIERINLDLVNKLLENNDIKEIFFKNNPDPGYKTKLPTKEEIEKNNINVLEGWLDRDKYLSIVNKCNIYIAPREYEGIGMSFLEAMSTGAVVISPNNPTMNEYIKNGIDGYLYNIKNPQKIDLSNIKTIQENIIKKVQDGFNMWQQQQKDILVYIEKPVKIKNERRNFLLFCIYNFITESNILFKKLLK